MNKHKNILKSKGGFILELIAFMIVGIIVVAFFAAMMYGFRLINTELISGKMDAQGINMTQAAENTFSNVNAGMDRMTLMAAIILIGYALGTLIFAVGSSKSPIWAFVYIGFSLLLVYASRYISNAHMDLINNSAIGSTVSEFTTANIIVSYLPYWVGLIGIIGSVVCFFSAAIGRRLLGE